MRAAALTGAGPLRRFGPLPPQRPPPGGIDPETGSFGTASGRDYLMDENITIVFNAATRKTGLRRAAVGILSS